MRVVLDLERVVLEHAFVVAELPFVVTGSREGVPEPAAWSLDPVVVVLEPVVVVVDHVEEVHDHARVIRDGPLGGSAASAGGRARAFLIASKSRSAPGLAYAPAPMLNARPILDLLSRDELLRLADHHGVLVGDRRQKGHIADRLEENGPALPDLLVDLSRDRLKELCRALGLDDSGKGRPPSPRGSTWLRRTGRRRLRALGPTLEW